MRLVLLELEHAVVVGTSSGRCGAHCGVAWRYLQRLGGGRKGQAGRAVCRNGGECVVERRVGCCGGVRAGVGLVVGDLLDEELEVERAVVVVDHDDGTRAPRTIMTEI